jgi:parvulin-like peptidyl-prolyl isomerase
MSRVLVCLIFGALAWAQAAKPPSPTPPQKPSATQSGTSTPDATQVPLTAAVITIPGTCDTQDMGKAQASDCKTVITRAEFEQLLDAVAPAAPPAARRQLASRYASALVMANQAHEMGLDKGSRYEALIKIGRIQVSAQELVKHLQEKSATISDKEVEDYYHNNGSSYQEADVQRLYIPRTKQPDAKEKLSDEEAKKRDQDSQDAMKKEAETLRARAAAGEDLDALQQEASTMAGLSTSTPNTKLGKVRRTTLPPDQSAVMDLKAGQVSEVFSSPGGYFVYKVLETNVLPLEKVREEIRGTLRSQRMKDSMAAIQQAATPQLNEQYFGQAPATPQEPPRDAKPTAKSPDSAPK